jgi:stress response protein YsnF
MNHPRMTNEPVGSDTEPDGTVLPVIREEIALDRETLATGSVEVRVTQRESVSRIELEATQDRVEVERVPIGREVDRAEPPRQEGDDFIVPVYEEVVRVERRLVLKEEIRLRRRHETRRWQQQVVLRHDEPVISRQGREGDGPRDDSPSISTRSTPCDKR